MTDSKNRAINDHRERKRKIRDKEGLTVTPALTKDCNKQTTHRNSRRPQVIKGVKDFLSDIHEGNNKWRTGSNDDGEKLNRWQDKILPWNRWNKVKKNIKERSINECKRRIPTIAQRDMH